MYFLKLFGLILLSVLCLVLIMFVIKFIAFLSSFLFGFQGEILVVSVAFFSFVLFCCVVSVFGVYEEHQAKEGAENVK